MFKKFFFKKMPEAFTAAFKALCNLASSLVSPLISQPDSGARLSRVQIPCALTSSVPVGNALDLSEAQFVPF